MVHNSRFAVAKLGRRPRLAVSRARKVKERPPEGSLPWAVVASLNCRRSTGRSRLFHTHGIVETEADEVNRGNDGLNQND